MKQFKKMYVEITNICNLSCSFCPPTKRPPHSMTVEEFRVIAKKIRPYGQYLYLHVKGEPTLHPHLAEILKICESLSFKVCITTNGTLLRQVTPLLLSSKAVHKVHISLHSFEANQLSITLEEYLDSIVSLIQQAPFLVVLRLWNEGGVNQLNQSILSKLKEQFTFLREDKITETAYLEHGDKFEWADTDKASEAEHGFCYALRNQIAILVDGTVVPCCLDNDGVIDLGNIFTQSLEEIYHSERAQALYQGFSNRIFSEKLCTTCGFIKRFD